VTEATPQTFSTRAFLGAHGDRMVFHEMGPASGRPVVLIHGLFSNAHVNWIKYGHAAKLAAAGRRVVMPDLRAHGESARSHAAADYTADILADDNLGLVEQLGLQPGAYDLAGYSLGARTTARMLTRGAKPGKAMLAGMGLEGLLDLANRADFFRRVLEGAGSHERFSPEWMAEAFLKTTGGDPKALLLLIGSFPTVPRAALETFHMPVMVLTGAEDNDNGSARALAEALPSATYVEVPGNHMSVITRPDFGDALAGWF